MRYIINNEQRWENCIHSSNNIVAESGIQVKRLSEFIVGDEGKKVVTLQISTVGGNKNTSGTILMNNR